MNEIAKQIIEVGKLMGKKVFIKRYSYDEYYYNDSEKIETFTLDDLEYYIEAIIQGETELWDIVYTGKSSDYYLITFKDLIFIC